MSVQKTKLDNGAIRLFLVVEITLLLMNMTGFSFETINIGSFYSRIPCIQNPNSTMMQPVLSLLFRFDLMFLPSNVPCGENLAWLSAHLLSRTNYKVTLYDKKNNSLGKTPIVYNAAKLTVRECESLEVRLEEKYTLNFCSVYMISAQMKFNVVGFNTFFEKFDSFLDYLEKEVDEIVTNPDAIPLIFLGNLNYKRQKKIYSSKIVQLSLTEFNADNWALFCHGIASTDMILVFGSLKPAFIPGSTTVFQKFDSDFVVYTCNRCPVRISLNTAALCSVDASNPSVALSRSELQQINHEQILLQLKSRTGNAVDFIQDPNKSLRVQNQFQDEKDSSRMLAPFNQRTIHLTDQRKKERGTIVRPYPVAHGPNLDSKAERNFYYGNSQSALVKQNDYVRSTVSLPSQTNPRSTSAYHDSQWIYQDGGGVRSGNTDEKHLQGKEDDPKLRDKVSCIFKNHPASLDPFAASSYDPHLPTAQSPATHSIPTSENFPDWTSYNYNGSGPKLSARDYIHGETSDFSTETGFLSFYDCHKHCTEMRTLSEEHLSIPSVIFDENLPQI